MILVRRRLFWRIYLTLLASLVAAALVMGALFWFLGRAQRELMGPEAGTRRAWPPEISLYEGDGRLLAARGAPIPATTWKPGHWGPGRVLRLDLPDGRFALTRFGPPVGVRIFGILAIMLVVVGGVGLAAFPVTALLTRRLEALRAGMERWGAGGAYVPLDARGDDEVAMLARTFNDAAGRLEAFLAAQKNLLANASHELRSPLARLRLAVDAGTPEGKRTEVVRNLAEMDDLVGELLLASRLEHLSPELDRCEPVDLLGLAAEEAAHVDAAITGTIVEIFGDAVLLRRLIRNLLENAAKHGCPPIEVTVAALPEGAELVVDDAGAGIAPGDRERVFEPFFRPFGIGEAAGGWGLGLALVRQIAARHGGTATCETAPGGGSRFVVRLAGSEASRSVVRRPVSRRTADGAHAYGCSAR